MKTNDFPIVSFNELFHVGTLDKKDKQNNSLEGNGLSVSICPNEWREITDLLGDLYSCKKINNKFLDFHMMNDEQKEIILQFGIKGKYIEACKIYRVNVNGENSYDGYFTFLSYEQAIPEVDDEKEITIVDGYKANDIMIERTCADCNQGLVLDLLPTIYAEDVLKIDGVYWNDNLNVNDYSAPRGVISISQLNTWKFNKITTAK